MSFPLRNFVRRTRFIAEECEESLLDESVSSLSSIRSGRSKSSSPTNHRSGSRSSLSSQPEMLATDSSSSSESSADPAVDEKASQHEKKCSPPSATTIETKTASTSVEADSNTSIATAVSNQVVSNLTHGSGFEFD